MNDIGLAPKGSTFMGSASFASADLTAYTVSAYPKVVGGYRLDQITFNLTAKPSVWHRFWTGFFLGWEWIDAQDDAE